MDEEMPKVVILCGGKGTRMQPENKEDEQTICEHNHLRIVKAVCVKCGKEITPDTDSRIDTIFRVEGLK